MKKALFPQPESNPGLPYHKAAVLLTELHCQTDNYQVNWVSYNKDAILDYFWLVFMLNKVSPTICPVPVTVPLPSPVLYFSPKRERKRKEIPRPLQTA